jgi:hypothetical protein
MTFTKGEHVFVTLDRRTVEAIVVLVTARGNIGAVMFDDAILGGYVGLMPVFEPADGADPSAYTDPIGRRPVTITRVTDHMDS